MDTLLFEDFKSVKFISLKEKLTADELAEGLEPMDEIFRVCISKHAYKRMYDEQSRYCEYEWVENLLNDKATAILNSPMNEEILVLSDDRKMAIVINLTKIQGELSIILISVIRNVIYKNGLEIELDNKSRATKTVI